MDDLYWWVSSRLTAEGEWTPFFLATVEAAVNALHYFGPADVRVRLASTLELRAERMECPLAWESAPFKYPWTLARAESPDNGGIGFAAISPYVRMARRQAS